MSSSIKEKFCPLKENGSNFVSASALKFEGNWKENTTYAELLDSCTFKVSGDCRLQGHNYMAQFVIGLTHHHTIGRVKIETSSPKQESEEDLSNQTSELVKPLLIGLCGDDHVEYSLTSVEPHRKMQKGLIVYGVSFTLVGM
ncbi:hypothetical protein DCAR_0205372 [Daucus carota subsp. sativus]|uniref:Uncharacterized protein n=1 Tax=Daucus carota subsp. sativus TaxID=79200 RepID=A0A166CKM4_DAUCS|nr:hypothetical protein DCAR_0205372 [Daucus carota subsp. sativus]